MRLIMCNAPANVAEAIALKLLEHRLAACVNIVPNVRSLYWWNGSIQDESECTLWIKTTQAREAEVRRAIAKLHPYEVPEILVVNVSDVHPPYLAWVKRETAPMVDARSGQMSVAPQVSVPPVPKKK